MQTSIKISFTLILVNFVAISTCQSVEESDDTVALMTTVEPIDGEGSVSFKNASANVGIEEIASCSNVSECDSCKSHQGCNWVHCEGSVEGAYCTDSMSESCTPQPCNMDPCTNLSCADCVASSAANCSWLNCESSTVPFCSPTVAELCQQVDCDAANVTVAPDSETTTTVSPNTTSTTTEPPTTTTLITTSSPDTTTITEAPNDTTTTTEEPTTTTPTTAVPTTVPTTTSTTSAPPPAPASGGFSAGSFFGGITLTLALLAVGYGGFKFYKTRFDVNYRTL